MKIISVEYAPDGHFSTKASVYTNVTKTQLCEGEIHTRFLLISALLQPRFR
jgi:hypothetical protein